MKTPPKSMFCGNQSNSAVIVGAEVSSVVEQQAYLHVAGSIPVLPIP